MLQVQPVQDLNLPELSPYRTMRWQEEHRKQGIFVAEGEKVVRRLLESHLEIVSLLLPEKWLQVYADLLREREEEVRVYTAEKKLLETLTGFSMYQGVLAVAKVPQPLTLTEALASAKLPRLIVAVEGLSNAENLGALIRNAVAFGCDALLVGETCCSPYLRRAVRSSMGTIFKLPVIETQHLTTSIHELRQHQVRCTAAHPHIEGKMLSNGEFRGDTCVIFGSEGPGLTGELIAACDEAIAIPMQNETDSLNVATAAAVFLYEVNRQRNRA